jgi:hypothetical protein
VALTALVSVPHAQAAPRGAECQLSGSASISPGLSTTAKAQRITLSKVTLTGCNVGSTSSAGVPKAITGAVTTSPNPIRATASCASGNLALTATIRWSTKKTTVATLTTTGLAVNQFLRGKVSSSTDPNLKAGDTVAGYAAFRPTTSAQNCTKVAVTAVTFSGVLALGSPK